ncbi:MAG: TrkH family potassium uptake protein [Acutalibacteraceae bacterium]
MNKQTFKKQVARPLKPATTIAISFIAIIIIGTLLFMLPFMTRDGKGLNFMQGLFTATSSVCVTGLTLIDPAVTLSRYGQVLLLILIEIGGISMITFASFFLFVFRKRSGLRSMRLAQEYTNMDSFSQVRPLVRVIISTAFICQFAGAVLLCFRFVPLYGPKGIWISLFTAVSAYCNAGFDIFGTQMEFGSLIPFEKDPYVLCVVMAMIILGGLGFFVFYDLINYRKTKHLSLHTKVVVITTLILIAFGFAGFFIGEYSNEATIGNLPLRDKIINSLFQSVTTRTAGFASVDIASVRDVTKVIMIVLMFIGAGSGSTGGGIKITTFAVLMMTVVSVLRNRDETVIFGKKVNRKIVSKSLAIVVLGLIVVFAVSCILIADLPQTGEIDLLFESVSAFATVGLSAGVTTSLGLLGILTIILTMFIGRLGPICFIIALNIKEDNNKMEVLPEGRIMVG